ncbi:hypothetical protein Pelo_15404 [Pelomyxa schiedti]|nr:hypothetical protein Pelo_15404 [Pelomyxa schiedti]
MTTAELLEKCNLWASRVSPKTEALMRITTEASSRPLTLVEVELAEQVAGQVLLELRILKTSLLTLPTTTTHLDRSPLSIVAQTQQQQAQQQPQPDLARLAQMYDQTHPPTAAMIAAALQKLQQPGRKVMEAGTGAGPDSDLALESRYISQAQSSHSKAPSSRRLSHSPRCISGQSNIQSTPQGYATNMTMAQQEYLESKLGGPTITKELLESFINSLELLQPQGSSSGFDTAQLLELILPQNTLPASQRHIHQDTQQPRQHQPSRAHTDQPAMDSRKRWKGTENTQPSPPCLDSVNKKKKARAAAPTTPSSRGANTISNLLNQEDESPVLSYTLPTNSPHNTNILSTSPSSSSTSSSSSPSSGTPPCPVLTPCCTTTLIQKPLVENGH